MSPADIASLLESTFGAGKIPRKKVDVLDPWIAVAPEAIIEVGRFCHDDSRLNLHYLKDMSAVDWLIKDEKKATKLGIEPHLEVLYHLFSFKHKHDITLKVFLPRWKAGVEGELPELASTSLIWRAAEWHEREIFDLMGIKFTDHPGLRRILCSEDWVGHPLRKDYVFPLEYHGIRCQ